MGSAASPGTACNYSLDDYSQCGYNKGMTNDRELGGVATSAFPGRVRGPCLPCVRNS